MKTIWLMSKELCNFSPNSPNHEFCVYCTATYNDRYNSEVIFNNKRINIDFLFEGIKCTNQIVLCALHLDCRSTERFLLMTVYKAIELNRNSSSHNKLNGVDKIKYDLINNFNNSLKSIGIDSFKIDYSELDTLQCKNQILGTDTIKIGVFKKNDKIIDTIKIVFESIDLYLNESYKCPNNVNLKFCISSNCFYCFNKICSIEDCKQQCIICIKKNLEHGYYFGVLIIYVGN